MFKDLEFGIYLILALAALGVTLGLWKLIELGMWICQHLHWS